MKKWIILLMLMAFSARAQTTRSIAPRVDGEGSVGLVDYRWGSFYGMTGVVNWLKVGTNAPANTFLSAEVDPVWTASSNNYLLNIVYSNGISTPHQPAGGTYIVDPTNGWRQWIHASGAVTVQAWNALGRTNTAEAVLVHFKLAAGGTVVFSPANGLTNLSGAVTTEIPWKVMFEKPPVETSIQYRIFR